MHSYENEARLPECVEVGLLCEDCVSSSASTIAIFCGGLGRDGIGAAFRLLYYKPECQSMHSAFHFHYIQATRKEDSTALAAMA